MHGMSDIIVSRDAKRVLGYNTLPSEHVVDT